MYLVSTYCILRHRCATRPVECTRQQSLGPLTESLILSTLGVRGQSEKVSGNPSELEGIEWRGVWAGAVRMISQRI